MSSLLKKVRGIENLNFAWLSVRENVLAKGSKKSKHEVNKISQRTRSYLNSLQKKLKENTFKFKPQQGTLKSRSGKNPRALVIADVETRIVQRALLNVLQSNKREIRSRLGEIPNVAHVPTSFGGIPKKGVPDAIEKIKNFIKQGAKFYFRSDIRDFFTKIPKDIVIDYIKSQTGDSEFSEFLRSAISTEISNLDELKSYIHLFPTKDVGVPQGSSLSAFIGNIILREFDEILNGRGIMTIRYIDDFVILGKSQPNVKTAFDSAKKILHKIGMDAYDPTENNSKAKIGEIEKGFDFLGCTINLGNISPSKKSRNALIKELKDTLSLSHKTIGEFRLGNIERRAEKTFIQTLAQLDKKIRGWGDAFGFCNNRLTFHQLDNQIDTIIINYTKRYQQLFQLKNQNTARRMLGIALLKDTKKYPSF